MSFLPNDYEPPQTSGYMKLVNGKSRFRILSNAIVGNEFWRKKGDGREPVRRRMHETIAASELELRAGGEPEKVKHFWAFVVWNYGASSVQILEITQRSIQSALTELINSDDWRDPKEYDVVVTRSGSGLDTEYSVQPTPAKPIDPAIVASFGSMNIDLEALFGNGDPFGKSNGQAAPPPSDAPPTEQRVAAMRLAWTKFNEQHKGKGADAIEALWKQAIASYFDGKPKADIMSVGWNRFIDDGFRPVESPIGEEPVFAEDDIPFD